MDLRIFTEPQQGASYAEQLAVALATETLGFDGFFRSDHFLPMGAATGRPGPTDAWTTLAGLARETRRIRLGTLVTSATFRHPGVLAVQVAQVDQMSGGRVELGLGAGWYAAEHAAIGVPFPDRRFGMLTEQLELINGLWRTPPGRTFDYAGEHYALVDAPGLPKPVQRSTTAPEGAGVPIIIGGVGLTRTPALAARFAAEFNAPFAELGRIPELYARARAACVAIGREPRSLICSAALVLCVGSDEAEFRRRAAAIGWEPDELRRSGIAGTVPEAADRLAGLAADGSQRIYLQVLDLGDLDHLDLLAREVVTQL
jgi:F420-dependent oxidoreductase-like protein